MTVIGTNVNIVNIASKLELMDYYGVEKPQLDNIQKRLNSLRDSERQTEINNTSGHSIIKNLFNRLPARSFCSQKNAAERLAVVAKKLIVSNADIDTQTIFNVTRCVLDIALSQTFKLNFEQLTKAHKLSESKHYTGTKISRSNENDNVKKAARFIYDNYGQDNEKGLNTAQLVNNIAKLGAIDGNEGKQELKSIIGNYLFPSGFTPKNSNHANIAKAIATLAGNRETQLHILDNDFYSKITITLRYLENNMGEIELKDMQLSDGRTLSGFRAEKNGDGSYDVSFKHIDNNANNRYGSGNINITKDLTITFNIDGSVIYPVDVKVGDPVTYF